MKRLVPVTFLLVCFILTTPYIANAGHTVPSFGDPQPCDCNDPTFPEPCYDDRNQLCNYQLNLEVGDAITQSNGKGLKFFNKPFVGSIGKAKLPVGTREAGDGLSPSVMLVVTFLTLAWSIYKIS